MLIPVHVTEADIREGTPRNSAKCMIAVAAMRAGFGTPHVDASEMCAIPPHYVRSFDLEVRYELAEGIGKFVDAFDDRDVPPSHCPCAPCVRAAKERAARAATILKPFTFVVDTETQKAFLLPEAPAGMPTDPEPTPVPQWAANIVAELVEERQPELART